MRTSLPVLPFGGYRQFPARAAEQAGFRDERDVCGRCLSGACCSTEGPIALTAFDVLRLATFFDMSPAEFLLAFTQDRFPGEPDTWRRDWIDNAASSIVTYLRRRANHPTSPCIFLKYVRDEDGTPRRRCSVHPARPLACREYYYDTCKRRWTGELAVTHAEGLEMVRDGLITPDLAEAQCQRLEPVADDDPLAKRWRYAFWSEMRRALDVERVNDEGANSYPIADFQDPLDDKVNRLLSARHLRFEEKYGPEPHGEQVEPYSAGLSFKGSPDHARILRIIREAPAGGWFAGQDYPHYVALRTMLAGVQMAGDFGRAYASAAGDFEGAHAAVGDLERAPAPAVGDSGRARASAARDQPWAAAMARGWDFLLGLAGHAARIGELLEFHPPGTFEVALLEAVLPFDEPLQRRVAGAACLARVTTWAAAGAGRLFREWHASLAAAGAGSDAWLRLWSSAAPFASGAAPRDLRRTVQRIRIDASRRLPPAWRQDRFDRWAARTARPRTPGAWSRLIARLPELRAHEALGPPAMPIAMSIRVLEKLEGASFPEIQPAPAFEALDALVRASRRLSAPFRRRTADLALCWSSRVEDQDLWAGDLGLRWPGLCGRLGIAGAGTPGFARSLSHILASQGDDGSWGIDRQSDGLPAWQSAYLLEALRATSLAVESLGAALRLPTPA
jgi:Fe-S-cluster containining protein